MSSFSRKSQKIRELAGNPEAQMNAIAESTGDLHKVMPNITTALGTTALNGINYLNAKLPRPSNDLPLDQEWEPTKVQQSDWLERHSTVEDPIKVLDHVRDGSLTHAHMEALQAVHPDLLKDMQSKVMDNMTANAHKTLPYATKIALSKFLGQPLSNSQLPQVVAANQATFAMSQQGPAQGGKSKGSTQSGLAKLKVGDMAATQVDKLESGKDE